MIDVTWHPHYSNLIVWHFAENWDFEDFHNARNEADRMIDTVDGTVDSLFLTPRNQVIPKAGLTNLRRLAKSQHSRHHDIVVVGAGDYLTTMLQLIGEIVPGFEDQLFFTRTTGEAYSLLEKHRLRVLVPHY